MVVLNMQVLGDKPKDQEEEDLKDEKVSGKPREDVFRKSLDANFH